MSNYVMLSMEYSKAKQYLKIINHNNRKSKVDYLKNDNEKKYGNNIEKSFSTLEELQEKRKKQAKPKQYRRNNENEICEFILGFSEEQFKKCSKEEVFNLSIKLMEQIKAKWGFEPMEISFHLDEGKGDKTNVHAHLVFYNFNFEKNKSVLRKLTKKDFREFQDSAGNQFKELDFQRGKSKEETMIEHQKPQEYKNYKELKKTIDKEIQELKNIRDEIIKAKQQEAKTKEEKQAIEQDLKTIRTKMEQLRKYAKSEAQQTIDKTDRTFFNHLNEEDLKTKIAKKIYNSLLVSVDLYELQEQKEKIQELEQVIEKIKIEHQKEILIAKQYIENGKRESIELRKTIQEQEKEIKSLENNLEGTRKRIKTYELYLKDNNYLEEKMKENKEKEQKTQIWRPFRISCQHPIVE